MKTFIITSCSYTPGVERWTESVSRNKEGAVAIIVMFHRHFEAPRDFLVYRQEEDWPQVVRKFYPVPDIVREHGLDNWYVWTDCNDVVMQHPLPRLEQFDSDLLVCSEHSLHNEVAFWNPLNYIKPYNELLGKMIYNVGCFAAKGGLLIEFITQLREICVKNKLENEAYDQVHFNYWLRKKEFKCIDRLFLCLFSTYTHGHRLPSEEKVKLVRFEDNMFRQNGVPYCFVHGNGAGKRFLRLFENGI